MSGANPGCWSSALGEALTTLDEQHFRLSLHFWSVHFNNYVIYRDKLVIFVYDAASEPMSHEAHDQSRALSMLSLFDFTQRSP